MGSTAAVRAIQEAVCHQRYNYQLWMALSKACVTLSNTLKSPEECGYSKTGQCCSDAYLKEPSVSIIKKAVILMRPHCRLFNSNCEENNSNRTVSDNPVATDVDTLWIIDVLRTAMTDVNDQLSVVKMADCQIFHHFLIILSCTSCLWARYGNCVDLCCNIVRVNGV